jgi:hypothetical protein
MRELSIAAAGALWKLQAADTDVADSSTASTTCPFPNSSVRPLSPPLKAPK